MKLWQRRAIGIFTLGGGAIGVVSALTLLTSRSNVIEWLLCLTFLGLYAWGVWSGVRLLEQKAGAEHATLKYWLIQIPAFNSPIFGYFFASGFHLTLLLQISPFRANGNFMLGSSFKYSLLGYGQPWLIGVNLFAAGVAWWLACRHEPEPDNLA